MKRIIFIIIILLFTQFAYSSKFDELDKPPEGAHKGQILLGAFATLGGVFGKIITAEGTFLKYSTYTFLDNYITKTIKVNHLPFSYGLFCEYMPVDYLGIKIKVRRSSIIQRTLFGSQYENWSRVIYSDFAIHVGPSIHTTNRKQWDITFTPLIGYALGEYTATPIAAKLIYEYAGSRRKRVLNLTSGAELNLNFYFSGGFTLTLGSEYILNILKFDSRFLLYNPQTHVMFFLNKSESLMHSISFAFSCGYAFSN